MAPEVPGVVVPPVDSAAPVPRAAKDLSLKSHGCPPSVGAVIQVDLVDPQKLGLDVIKPLELPRVLVATAWERAAGPHAEGGEAVHHRSQRLYEAQRLALPLACLRKISHPPSRLEFRQFLIEKPAGCRRPGYSTSATGWSDE